MFQVLGDTSALLHGIEVFPFLYKFAVKGFGCLIPLCLLAFVHLPGLLACLSLRAFSILRMS